MVTMDTTTERDQLIPLQLLKHLLHTDTTPMDTMDMAMDITMDTMDTITERDQLTQHQWLKHLHHTDITHTDTMVTMDIMDTMDTTMAATHTSTFTVTINSPIL